MIAIVDYGRGNLLSIAQAVRHVGGTCEVTSDSDRLCAARHVILPGVGAFGDAMRGLVDRRLAAPLRDIVGRGTPLLGICLGMQVLTDSSTEFGRHDGLGFMSGHVERLPEGAMRIPNVGWRPLHCNRADDFTAGLPDGAMMYFVHSYTPVMANVADVTATIAINGRDIAAIIRKERVIGCQFHPEKSGPEGLNLIRNFVNLPAD